MVDHDTEDVISKQRVGEHKNILDLIAMLDKRLSKVEDKTHNAGGDKALLSKLNMDVAENRADLYYVEDELRNHRKDAHISQGQVKKWIHELYSGEVKKIEEATNGKD